MDLFKEHLLILDKKNDVNQHSYLNLLMYCKLYDDYKRDNTIIFDRDFIRGLYKIYRFGGAQREKNEELEYQTFISSFFFLIEHINAFYRLKIPNSIDLIEKFINLQITKNTSKPFKTGLIDFLNYTDLYDYIFKNNLQEYEDIILNNNKFFTTLLSYLKDIGTTYNSILYSECEKHIKKHAKEYSASDKSLLWLIQQIIIDDPEYSVCAFKMLKAQFISFIYNITPELIEALKRIFIINNEENAKKFIHFIDIFFNEYKKIDIYDTQFNECKLIETTTITCPNDTSLRFCPATLIETRQDYGMDDLNNSELLHLYCLK